MFPTPRVPGPGRPLGVTVPPELTVTVPFTVPFAGWPGVGVAANPAPPPVSTCPVPSTNPPAAPVTSSVGPAVPPVVTTPFDTWYVIGPPAAANPPVVVVP